MPICLHWISLVAAQVSEVLTIIIGLKYGRPEKADPSDSMFIVDQSRVRMLVVEVEDVL